MNLRAFSLIPVLIFLVMSGAQAVDRILSYHSDVVIHKDTSMTVTELISVSVGGGDIKHGIFRDFPTIYKSDNGFVRERGFKIIKVSLNDNPEQFTMENIEHGKRVRIGSASVSLLPGTYEYRIQYKTNRQLGYFVEHDELYWNVTGNGWKFPIDRITATVTLPDGAVVTNTLAWTGSAGSNEKSVTSEVLKDGRVNFISQKKLRPHQGLTFKITFPKGHLDYAKDKDGWWVVAKDNPAIFFVLLVFVLTLVLLLVGWFREGIDPKKGTIIPRYKAPDGFSAAAVRYLRITGYDETVFTVAILSLASKGALLIQEIGDTAMLKKRAPRVVLEPDEDDLYKDLFVEKDTLVLAPINADILLTAKSKLTMNLRRSLVPGFFSKNSKYIYAALGIFCGTILGLGLLVESVPLGSMGMHLIAVGCLWLCGSALLRKWNGKNRNWMALIALLGATAFWCISVYLMWREVHPLVASVCVVIEVMLLIFNHLVKAYTVLGRMTLDEIEGLKMYLEVAEKDRLSLENPPDRTPEHFEEFLPFALALGVDQQWAEQFHSVLAGINQLEDEPYSPSFFQGGDNGLGAAGIGAGLAGATAAIASTLGANLSAASVSPSSSDGGSYSSGGYSGGGSSGGGGGGGGGGGW